MSKPNNLLQKGDGLLLVDVQKDFCPGGSLAIEKGDKILPVLNSWIEAARKKEYPIYASRDWHPLHHVSFTEQGGKWPPHCIQDSEGAEFHPNLMLPGTVVKITKGVRFDQDQNSVFDQTGFADQLRRDNIRRLWVGGLARDVCVLASVLDGRQAGFEIHVLWEGTRPVTPEGGQDALEGMKRAGALILE
jgi:nicotinamidase/pyrazinamidase